MKKSLFLAAAAVAMLTSCSNDEMLQEAQAPQSAIGFKTFVNRTGRGVTDVTLNNMAQFNVWGYQSPSNDATGVVTRFNNQEVIGNAGNFTYSPLQYWTPGNYYWFTAYSADENRSSVSFVPDATAWPTTITTTTNPLWGAKIYFNNSNASATLNGTELDGAKGDVDLLYAWWKTDGAVVTGSEPTVDLSFKHLLSKVAFKFTNGLPESSIKITALSIESVHSTGTLDMTTTSPAWVRGDGTFNLSYANDISNSAIAPVSGGTKSSKTSGANCMIPGAFPYNIKFTVQQISGTTVLATYNHTVTVSDLTMAMGTYYVLTAEITTENINPEGALMPIVFNPSVEDWDVATEEEVTFPTPAEP